MPDRPALSAEEADALLESLPVTLPARQMGRNAHNTPLSVHDLVVEYGELTPDDHARAAEVQNKGTHATDLATLRHTHHRVAKLVASGLPAPTISAMTNMSVSRVHSLKSAPAFMELVAHYEAEDMDVLGDFAEIARGLSLDALHLLQERLLDNPGAFTVSMLNELVKTLADRSGNAPVARNLNLNVTADLADRMAAAERRLKEQAA